MRNLAKFDSFSKLSKFALEWHPSDQSKTSELKNDRRVICRDTEG